MTGHIYFGNDCFAFRINYAIFCDMVYSTFSENFFPTILDLYADGIIWY